MISEDVWGKKGGIAIFVLNGKSFHINRENA